MSNSIKDSAQAFAVNQVLNMLTAIRRKHSPSC